MTTPDSIDAKRLQLDRSCADRQFRVTALDQAIAFHRDVKNWLRAADPGSHIEPTPEDVVATAAAFLAFIERAPVQS